MLKDDIRNRLDAMREKLAPQPQRGNNKDPILYSAFFWQEVIAYAEAEQKKVLKEMVEDGIVPNDDELRAYEEGDHTVVSGDAFAFCTKITAPRKSFDKDGFLAAAVRKFKIPVAKISALAEDCVKKGVAPLSKKIVEI